MTLSKITIEIDLARNQVLRDMFRRPEAGKQLEPFLRGIELSGAEYRQGEIVGIDLTGPSDALSNFKRNFLDDEAPQVYSLSYAEDHAPLARV